MFKKLTILCFILGVTTAINAQIKTPQPSPAAKMTQMVGLTEMTLEYSRPAMRGRTIFGDLVPYGQVWRTGANANTTISFATDVTIGGTAVKKGTYAVFTVPNETSWDVMFYSDTNNWGAPREWDDAKVVAKVTAEVMEMPMNIESFTMTFDNLTDGSVDLGMLWENAYVGVTIEVPTDAIASKSIEAVMAGPSGNDYFAAATYYHTSGKDLEQALNWMKKATAGDNPPFWYLRRMSLIQADMGDKAGAIATATKSLAAAEKAGNADYVKMNKESIAEWSK